MVVSMDDILAMSQNLGIDISHVDHDSINLPPGEDFGIPSDDDDEKSNQEDAIKPETGYGNVIVVDKLPLVGPPETPDAPDRRKKLEGVVRRIYSKYGVIKEGGLWMPESPETENTLGYCFVECDNKQKAEEARKETNGFKFDKSHKLVVNLLEDFDKYMKIRDKWVPAEISPYTPGENLQQWLTDEKARDQFVIRAGLTTEIFWNDPRLSLPDTVYHRQEWTEGFIQWSPLGTYLATVHRQGVAVWGGASTFNRLMRYLHPQVKLMDFSPGEKYIVTYSSQEPSNPQDSLMVLVNIFDVRTCKLMRAFEGKADDFTSCGSGVVSGVSWPIFRWGGGREDEYFARIGKNTIAIYETKTFSLVDKKSLKVENVTDFCWSPTDAILALFVPELSDGNQPARVSLVQIPEKVELRQKNLFCVSDCKMYWQSNGEYLIVKVERLTKTKKSTYTGFELFRIKERDVPIEVFELENKNDKIVAFAWEPKGHRFAVIHGDSPRPDISFYSVNTGRITKLVTLKNKQSNALFWSPIGRFIVLAGLKGFNGQLEFYDVDELETMTFAEHFMTTNIDWDPTGRYVATSVSSVHEMETGFHIWSFYGKLLYKISKDHFYQFLWRPRPPSLLIPERVEEISKNLKKYSKKYEVEDQDVSVYVSEQEQLRRKRMQEEWDKWVGEWARLHREEKELRRAMRDGEDSDEEEEFEDREVEVEEVVGVREEVVSFEHEE